MTAPLTAGLLADSDALLEETVALPGRELLLVRPRNPEAFIDEERFEREEYMPYWVELWPSGVALARELAGRALRGARVLDLGCGLGTAAVAAALAGGRVLATDWSPEALAFTEENARRNGTAVTTELCDWSAPEPLLRHAPFDLVLAADVAYEARNVEPVASLLPQVTAPRGEIWLADPDRPHFAALLDALPPEWTRATPPAPAPGAAAVHRIRRR